MNEGLNLRVFETTTESCLAQDAGWLEETKGMVERGLRHMERSRPEMPRALTFKQRTRAEVAEAIARKKARKSA